MKREVKSISSKECYDWILKKHYAHRKPRMQFCYGLFVDNLLKGVVTFGTPATPFIARGLCGKEHENEVLELSRLVINSNVPQNSGSFLIGNAMKLIPEQYKIIVSYADTKMGHIGYVYQATNFLYTGLTIPMKEWKKKGDNRHSQNISKEKSLQEKKKDDSYEQIYRNRKHRYIFFIGNKDENKELKSKLKYSIMPYPKGEPKKYESNDIKEVQGRLI